MGRDEAIFWTDLKQDTFRSCPGNGISVYDSQSQSVHHAMVTSLSTFFHPARSFKDQHPIEGLPMGGKPAEQVQERGDGTNN